MDIKEIFAKVWPEWEPLEILGRGAYGVVYKACRRDFIGTSYAAVKVTTIPQDPGELEALRAEGLSEDQSRTYLESIVRDYAGEIRMMSRVRGYTNIVTIEDYQILQREGELCWDILIRMELLTPLNRHIAAHPLDEDEIIRLGIDLCGALMVCRESNIVHRDIKPENIFISDHGIYKLGDFGISRNMERHTYNMSRKGTYNYMAPEVFKGELHDADIDAAAKVDLYSLGLVLYRLANGGRLPFLPDKAHRVPGDYRRALDRRMAGEPLPPPENCSEELSAIILRACSPKPSFRYASAKAMRAALEKLYAQRTDSVSGGVLEPALTTDMIAEPDRPMAPIVPQTSNDVALDEAEDDASAPTPRSGDSDSKFSSDVRHFRRERPHIRDSRSRSDGGMSGDIDTSTNRRTDFSGAQSPRRFRLSLRKIAKDISDSEIAENLAPDDSANAGKGDVSPRDDLDLHRRSIDEDNPRGGHRVSPDDDVSMNNVVLPVSGILSGSRRASVPSEPASLPLDTPAKSRNDSAAAPSALVGATPAEPQNEFTPFKRPASANPSDSSKPSASSYGAGSSKPSAPSGAEGSSKPSGASNVVTPATRRKNPDEDASNIRRVIDGKEDHPDGDIHPRYATGDLEELAEKLRADQLSSTRGSRRKRAPRGTDTRQVAQDNATAKTAKKPSLPARLLSGDGVARRMRSVIAILLAVGVLAGVGIAVRPLFRRDALPEPTPTATPLDPTPTVSPEVTETPSPEPTSSAQEAAIASFLGQNPVIGETIGEADMRLGPSGGAILKRTLPYGVRVLFIDAPVTAATGEQWYQAMCESDVGWVAASDIARCDMPEDGAALGYIAVDTVGADAPGGAGTTIPAGTVFEGIGDVAYLGEEDVWVQLESVEGLAVPVYVSMNDVRVSAPLYRDRASAAAENMVVSCVYNAEPDSLELLEIELDGLGLPIELEGVSWTENVGCLWDETVGRSRANAGETTWFTQVGYSDEDGATRCSKLCIVMPNLSDIEGRQGILFSVGGCRVALELTIKFNGNYGYGAFGQSRVGKSTIETSAG